MANRPDGKPAGVEKVAFTRPAAERIAKAVRLVEAGNRDADGFGMGYRLQSLAAPKQYVRLCSWTTTWQYNTVQQVTLLGGATATATATNFFLGVQEGFGLIARRTSTASWGLYAAGLANQLSYDGQQIQVLGHNTNGYAEWYSVTTCATATAE